MATRLSYLFWGTMPDEPLRAAAARGDLASAAGVLAQARRLLSDARARPMIRFFFDNLLPISGLADLERNRTLFPRFSPTAGALLREETQRLLEHEIFEGSGTWMGALTAPHTFLNGPLATFYGVAGVQGDAFRKVPLDTTKRLGVLLQAGVMAGTTHSNETSPVVRGAYVVQKLLCRTIPLPTADILDQVKPPDPYSGKTARERYGAHSANQLCAGCHHLMDPVGLALENFDPVGLYRDKENGVTIDASGAIPGVEGTVSGPVDLVKQLAAAADTGPCFAEQWLQFAYGRALGPDDECTRASVEDAFRRSGGSVRELLLALTQTDAFLYLPEVR